jgi:hypothetical protein
MWVNKKLLIIKTLKSNLHSLFDAFRQNRTPKKSFGGNTFLWLFAAKCIYTVNFFFARLLSAAQNSEYKSL